MTILPSHRSTLEEGRVSKCGGQKFAALAVLKTARNCIIGTSSFTVRLHRIVYGSIVGGTDSGGTDSGEAVIFGHNIGSLSPCRGPNIRAAGSFFGLLFFVFPLLAFFANVVSGLTFGWVAEKDSFQSASVVVPFLIPPRYSMAQLQESNARIALTLHL